MSKREYRINGFELIKGFYSLVFEGAYPFKPQHVSLYVFLLNQNNRLNWIEWFKCPLDIGMHGSCMSSKRMYYKCLNDLNDWGLIDYQPGQNAWKAPRIRLKVEVSNSTSIIPQGTPLGEPVQTPVQEPLPIPVGEPVGAPIYKPITPNPKLETKNMKQPIEESDKSDSLSKRADNIIDLAQGILNPGDESKTEFAREVLTYLNTKTGSKYLTKKIGRFNLAGVTARKNEGHTLEDFQKVIDIKTAEWKGGTMEKYLRPETLFGSKFESYLNQKNNGTAGEQQNRINSKSNHGFHRAEDTDHTAFEL